MAGPILVALFAIPLLIEGLGKERFGLLTIIWMGVGYFSLFDLGLGRALTKLVSERLGNGKTEDMGLLIWTALTLMAMLGAFGGALILVFAEPLVTGLLNVDSALHGEAILAFRILAAGLPFVVVTAALIGLLEAHQRFSTIAAIRIPLGILTFAGPLVTVQITPSLAWATGVLLLGRSLSLIACFAAVTRSRKELLTPALPSRSHMKPLFSFGGWLTVTNIVGPLMTYLDRFFVGAILNMSAVAYYATPYEILSKVQVIPHSIMGVMFPAMSSAIAGDQQLLSQLYAASVQALLWMMLPITASFFLLGPEALGLWLGEDFRKASAPVVQWLALGWMINTLARPPSTVLQSAGRPDLVAKAHLLELVPYLFALWFLTTIYGIVGTAMAWTLRIVVDTLVLNELAGKHFKSLHREIYRTRVNTFVIIAGFGAAQFLDNLFLRLILLLMVIGGAGMGLWPIIKQLQKPGTLVNA